MQDETLQHHTEKWTPSEWIMDGVGHTRAAGWYHGCVICAAEGEEEEEQENEEEEEGWLDYAATGRERVENECLQRGQRDNNHDSLLEAALFSDPASRLLQTHQYK